MSKSYTFQLISPLKIGIIALVLIPSVLGLGYWLGNTIGFNDGYNDGFGQDIQTIYVNNTNTIIKNHYINTTKIASQSNISMNYILPENLTMSYYDNSSRIMKNVIQNWTEDTTTQIMTGGDLMFIRMGIQFNVPKPCHLNYVTLNLTEYSETGIYISLHSSMGSFPNMVSLGNMESHINAGSVGLIKFSVDFDLLTAGEYWILLSPNSPTWSLNFETMPNTQNNAKKMVSGNMWIATSFIPVFKFEFEDTIIENRNDLPQLFKSNNTDYLSGDFIVGNFKSLPNEMINLETDACFVLNETMGDVFQSAMIEQMFFTNKAATIVQIRLCMEDKGLGRPFKIDFDYIDQMFSNPYPLVKLNVNQSYNIELVGLHFIIQDDMSYATAELDLLINHVSYISYSNIVYEEDWVSIFP